MVNLFSGQIAFALLLVPFCVVTLARSDQVFAHSRRRRSKTQQSQDCKCSMMTFFGAPLCLYKGYKNKFIAHPVRVGSFTVGGLAAAIVLSHYIFTGRWWPFRPSPEEETSTTTVQTPKPRVKVHFWVYVFYSMVVAMVVIFPIEVYWMCKHCERQQAKQLERARSERARLRRLERRRLRGGTEAIESREED